MDTPQIVLILVVGVALPLFCLYVARTYLKSKPYEFEMIFMKPGVNDHAMIKGSSLEFDHKHDGKKYEITSDNIYRIKPGIVTRLWWKFRCVKARFLIIYQHTKTKPVSPGTVKVSAGILKEVNDSSALHRALKSEFAVPMDIKKILMIIGFLIIVIVAYILVTGEVVM